MTGVKRTGSRRVAASSSSGNTTPPEEGEQNWTTSFTEHKIDTVIYEHDEEEENANSESVAKNPDEADPSSAAVPSPQGPGRNPRNTGTDSNGDERESVTRQTSLKDVFEAKREKRVIIVCHDEHANIVPLSGSDNVSRESLLNTPASGLDEHLRSKTETNSLLIEVSDKLNSMPKHHRITLSNSIPTDDGEYTDSLRKKFRSKVRGDETPDTVLSDSDDKLNSNDKPDAPAKRRSYQRKLGMANAHLSLDVEGGKLSNPRLAFDDVEVGKMSNAYSEITLSVPNLYALSESSRSTPRVPRARVCQTPRLTPKASPRLSPRLAHTVHNVKKKISEAMKHEMAFLVSRNKYLCLVCDHQSTCVSDVCFNFILIALLHHRHFLSARNNVAALQGPVARLLPCAIRYYILSV